MTTAVMHTNGAGWVANDTTFGARLALVRQRMAWGYKANPDGGSKGPGGIRKAQIKLELIERDGFRCAYCSREFVDLDDATLDHVIPNCLVAHWEPWNLVLACGPCNNAKGDKVPLVLLPMLSHLLIQLATSAQFRTSRKAKAKKRPGQLTPPIPTHGFPSKSAYRRAVKERYQTQWTGRKVSAAVEAMTGHPVRLALPAAPVRAALPSGGQA